MFDHDYFFLKALDVVRPGGIVAMITAKGTLDKKNSRIRKILAKKADLLCAIRLPETAFAETGAEVSTDLFIFSRKRKISKRLAMSLNGVKCSTKKLICIFGTHRKSYAWTYDGRKVDHTEKRFVCKEKRRYGLEKHVLIIFHLESYLKMFMNQVRQLRITMKNMFRQ